MTIYKKRGQLVAAVVEAVKNLPGVSLCRVWPVGEA